MYTPIFIRQAHQPPIYVRPQAAPSHTKASNYDCPLIIYSRMSFLPEWHVAPMKWYIYIDIHKHGTSRNTRTPFCRFLYYHLSIAAHAGTCVGAALPALKTVTCIIHIPYELVACKTWLPLQARLSGPLSACPCWRIDGIVYERTCLHATRDALQPLACWSSLRVTAVVASILTRLSSTVQRSLCWLGTSLRQAAACPP